MLGFLKILCVALLACVLAAACSLGLRAVPRPSSSRSHSTSGPSIIVARRFQNDYAASDEEFQNLLDELRRESEAASEPKIIEDPHNYINSDEELREFVRLSALEHQLATSRPSVDARDTGERALGGQLQAPAECSICMESLERPTNALDPVDLRCGHSFHYACLKDWFAAIRNERHKSCPNCRKECSSLLLVEHVNKRAAREELAGGAAQAA